MPNDIGKTLKEQRISARMSVKEISDLLTDRGFKASESTIYSWENGNSQPTPGALLTMCTAYNVDDVLATFGYSGYAGDGSLQLNLNETNLVERYRTLDDTGRLHAVSVLEWEAKRTEALVAKDQRIAELEASQSREEHSVTSVIEFQRIKRVRPYLDMGKIACAGTGFYFDDIPTDVVEVPYVPGADFVIGVSGDSMEPDYHDGERIYVQKVSDLTLGDVGIFTVWGECFIKELGDRGLISRNPSYADIPGSEDVRLIGRVLGTVEKD